MKENNDRFIETEYVNNVFEQPWWLELVAQDCWGECIVKRSEKVIARLPFVNVNGRICNPKLTQTLGIWMDDSLLKYESGNSQFFKQKEVIGELLNQLPKNKGISITLDNSVSYIIPFRWHGFHIEPSFSYRIDCRSNFDNIQNSFGKTVKKNVRAASKKLHVEISSTDVGTFIKLVDMSFERQKRKNPVNSELIAKVITGAMEFGRGRLMLALDEDGQAHSGAFFLYDDKVCYYLLGGQNPEFKSDGSQNLLLYKGIEFACSVSNYFDFEGSMVEGIENFFRQFGGNQVVNYQVVKQSIFYDMVDLLKPRIKKLIGYKI